MHMQNIPQTNEQEFETNHKYAIFAGWLIFPAIFTLLTFLQGAIMISFVNPLKISGYDLIIYGMDAFFFLYLIVVYFSWLKRKRIFPKLIMAFFFFYALSIIPYYLAGSGIDYISIIISIVWMIYFQRSKRVAQTFIR